eukprot:6194578-Amphidinium_carterae.1
MKFAMFFLDRLGTIVEPWIDGQTCVLEDYLLYGNRSAWTDFYIESCIVGQEAELYRRARPVHPTGSKADLELQKGHDCRSQ